MPVTTTFPGVYVEEVPSGVRTITGVSTAVTAFVGSTYRGPVNKAVRVQSFSTFERKFGGLHPSSEMSYAVKQFFTNGGAEGFVVRVAKDPAAAKRTLVDDAPNNALEITAIDEGLSGNDIRLRVDHRTPNPGSTFNLTIEDPRGSGETELYPDLSMNSNDPRYVETMINGLSALVTVKRLPDKAALDALSQGSSRSGILRSGGALLDVRTLRDANHDQFRLSVNGSDPVIVQIADADLAGADAAARMLSLCAAIERQVAAAAGTDPLLAGFTCAVDSDCILMTSGTQGEMSRVRVLPGVTNDLSVRLLLGPQNGGIEIDAVAAIRPREVPDPGRVTGGVLTVAEVPRSDGADPIPNAACNCLTIGLDGGLPATVLLGNTPAPGPALEARLTDIAARIEAAVRQLNTVHPAYKGFTCRAENSRLILTSGTRGDGSSVAVSAAVQNDIAARLKLLADAATVRGADIHLGGGSETPYNDNDAYGVFIGSRAQRKGIYTLEAVGLFNILCLPAVSVPGILQDAAAYCEERRAFLLIDAPATVKAVDQMEKLVNGPQLPKSKNAAIYFPWIKIADPRNQGRSRSVPPCGTIAGLYARTDTNRGVWKAPAGTEASLYGAQDVVYALTDRENGTLNPLGVNCVRQLPVYGIVAWGARTLRGADVMADEWKYVPIRRLALYLEESLYRGTHWVVFEPNDEPLWAQIRLNVGAFMHDLFRQGAFQGTTPRDAYFVKCDGETTTQSDRNRGVVNILVGFAPLKPAEFVIIKIQQMAGQVQS